MVAAPHKLTTSAALGLKMLLWLLRVNLVLIMTVSVRLERNPMILRSVLSVAVHDFVQAMWAEERTVCVALLMSMWDVGASEIWFGTWVLPMRAAAMKVSGMVLQMLLAMASGVPICHEEIDI